MYITCIYSYFFIIHNIALFVEIIDSFDDIGLQKVFRLTFTSLIKKIKYIIIFLRCAYVSEICMLNFSFPDL